MLMIGNVGGEYMGVYHTNMQFFSMFKVFLKDFKKREIMFLQFSGSLPWTHQ